MKKKLYPAILCRLKMTAMTTHFFINYQSVFHFVESKTTLSDKDL